MVCVACERWVLRSRLDYSLEHLGPEFFSYGLKIDKIFPANCYCLNRSELNP